MIMSESLGLRLGKAMEAREDEKCMVEMG